MTYEPKRILIAGDIHGNLHWVDWLYKQAAEYECDAIFQLGDFGYWEHEPKGIRFLDYIERRAAEVFNIPFYWLDGNHENHILLWNKYSETNAEGFVPVRSEVFYSPRGHTWEWHGKKFLTVGGAYSVDINYRTVGKSWWPTESIDNDDVAKASAVGKVDILLSHDVPDGVDIAKHFMLQRGTFLKNIRECERERKQLRRVVDAVEPEIVYHGHYHLRYNDFLTLDNGKVIPVSGLACDEMGNESALVLDL